MLCKDTDPDLKGGSKKTDPDVCLRWIQTGIGEGRDTKQGSAVVVLVRNCKALKEDGHSRDGKEGIKAQGAFGRKMWLRCGKFIT